MAHLVFVVGIACAGCNSVFDLDGTELANTNPRTLVFDNRASLGDLVDFPVPVRLDPSRIVYDDVANPRTDLRFHDPVSSQDLPFEIEQWVPGGASTVWVLVPRITARSTTDRIVMYFGPDAAGTEAPAAVWSSFALVAHGTDATYQSAPGAITATATGIASAEGPVASSMRFTRSGRHQIEFANSRTLFSGWQQFTIELWLYVDYPAATLGYEPAVIRQGPALNNGRLFQNATVSTYLQLQIDFSFTARTSYSPTFVPLQKWVHVLFTYDGQTLWIYRNGALAQIDRNPSPMTLEAPTNDFTLGGTDNVLDGMLDEVRISPAFRDDDWIGAQFLAMNGGFVTFRGAGEP